MLKSFHLHKPPLPPSFGAVDADQFDAVLARMSRLIEQLEQAIHAGQCTERIWEQLRACNLALLKDAKRGTVALNG